MLGVKCGVWRVKGGVGSVGCDVWRVNRGVWSLEYKVVLGSALCKMFHKSAEQECQARQDCLTRVSHKSVPQECPTRACHNNVTRECPIRLSKKIVKQKCCARVAFYNVIERFPFAFSYSGGILLLRELLKMYSRSWLLSFFPLQRQKTRKI